MGGRALKNTTTRRYERAEFDEISIELLSTLKKTFDEVVMPLFYKNKESFGDADILVTSANYPDMRNYIQDTFSPNEIFHNGNCWSFDYKELQVDIITCAPEHFYSNYMYLSYNDLGNFIGRLAHGFGLKFGQEGLWYEHEFKGQNIGTIYVSKDYPKIYEYLGLDYEVWVRGFNELEEIFTFIASSPFFNWKKFQFSELNKINRDRNKKRASYLTFLEWMDENVADEKHEHEFYEDKSKYLVSIQDSFPDANIITEIRRLEYEECKKLYIKAKFNGGDVMRKYGFKGKELGDKMTGFRAWMDVDGLYKNYDEFIITTRVDYIYKAFDRFLEEGINICIQTGQPCGFPCYDKCPKYTKNG